MGYGLLSLSCSIGDYFNEINPKILKKVERKPAIFGIVPCLLLPWEIGGSCALINFKTKQSKTI